MMRPVNRLSGAAKKDCPGAATIQTSRKPSIAEWRADYLRRKFARGMANVEFTEARDRLGGR